MRFVIYGAGAIGGVIGARLFSHGRSVVLIARGAHYEAIRDRGLHLDSPEDVLDLKPPVVSDPSQIRWTPDDLVILTMKTQDTSAALAALASAAPSTVPIFCVQNGVENERIALRYFPHVYGVYLWCPAGHLVPGVVQAWCAPTTGILDIGCYPSGVDTRCEAVGVELRASSFESEPRHDVMRWKYRKLLSNLGNAIEALCGPAGRGRGIVTRAREEALACYAAAGITFVEDGDRDAKQREQRVTALPINGVERQGGSTWQSLKRRAGSVEIDYLNGEICMLGRLHGVPTPVNALLQRLTNETLRSGRPPGEVTADQILTLLP